MNAVPESTEVSVRRADDLFRRLLREESDPTVRTRLALLVLSSLIGFVATDIGVSPKELCAWLAETLEGLT